MRYIAIRGVCRSQKTAHSRLFKKSPADWRAFLLEKFLIYLNLDSHVSRAELFAERGGESVG